MQSRLQSSALLEFQEAAANPTNPVLQEWKTRGGKIIGMMYHYVPEEIITAAGMLPYRMRATGNEGTELSESRFTQVNCSLVRHLFDSGMRGNLNFLDGVVSVNNCDHIRRLYDNWKAKIKTPYTHFMSFPKKSGPEQAEAYRRELEGFIKSLVEQFEVDISDEKLRNAIKLHNETRHLQRQLYSLKKSDAPPISGSETLTAMVAASCMPREYYNMRLAQLIEDCRKTELSKNHLARIMVIGGEIDDPGFITAIESQKGLVVTDLLGYGFRSCAKDVSTNGDPLTALADYQVNERPADPRIFGRTTEERDMYISKMVQDFNIDGIISVRLMQCDHWGFEQVNLTKHLRKKHIPHLALETEYILGSVGQLKTRVQAFVESIVEAKHVNN